MSTGETSREGDRIRKLFASPWPWLVFGLVACGVGIAVPTQYKAATLPFLLTGLLATGIGITILPGSPAVLGVAALTGLVSWAGMPAVEWDSARLLMICVTAFVALAALLMALPRVVRRAVVSLLVLFHFGGIAVAILQVPPTPWIATWLWTYCYRPYLQLMYLNNAYHFYAPEPGPGVLVWFRIQYDDGSVRWVKTPNREDHRFTLQYQRRLSFAESINQLMPPGQIHPVRRENRLHAGRIHKIPYHPDMPDTLQYREPNLYTQKMLGEYARWAANTYPHSSNVDTHITSIKIYRVLHMILNAPQIAERTPWDAKWLYYPYYQGDYDADGRIKNPQDPYLFWLIPILKKSMYREAFPNESADVPVDDPEVFDFVEKHGRLDSSQMDVPAMQPIPGAANPPGVPAK